MAIDVGNIIKAYSKIGLRFEDAPDVLVKSAFNTSDYIQLIVFDKIIFVKASDLIVAIHNAINNNHLG